VRRDGTRVVVHADRVIAATGYRTDFKRLNFLGPDLADALRLDHGAPVLNRDYETSVPGLYVIGPASALSFGPVARFVYGSAHPARVLARRFAAASALANTHPQADRLPVAAPSA
jgi:hypothetical protein